MKTLGLSTTDSLSKLAARTGQVASIPNNIARISTVVWTIGLGCVTRMKSGRPRPMRSLRSGGIGETQPTPPDPGRALGARPRHLRQIGQARLRRGNALRRTLAAPDHLRETRFPELIA